MEWEKIELQIDILCKDGLSFLSIHKSGDTFILRSIFQESTTFINYITTLDKIKKYLRSEITLKELYLSSEDLYIDRRVTLTNIPKLTRHYIADKIEYGNFLYSELADDIKNPDNWKYIYFADA